MGIHSSKGSSSVIPMSGVGWTACATCAWIIQLLGILHRFWKPDRAPGGAPRSAAPRSAAPYAAQDLWLVLGSWRVHFSHGGRVCWFLYFLCWVKRSFRTRQTLDTKPFCSLYRTLPFTHETTEKTRCIPGNTTDRYPPYNIRPPGMLHGTLCSHWETSLQTNSSSAITPLFHSPKCSICSSGDLTRQICHSGVSERWLTALCGRCNGS